MVSGDGVIAVGCVHFVHVSVCQLFICFQFQSSLQTEASTPFLARAMAGG